MKKSVIVTFLTLCVATIPVAAQYEELLVESTGSFDPPFGPGAWTVQPVFDRKPVHSKARCGCESSNHYFDQVWGPLVVPGDRRILFRHYEGCGNQSWGGQFDIYIIDGSDPYAVGFLAYSVEHLAYCTWSGQTEIMIPTAVTSSAFYLRIVTGDGGFYVAKFEVEPLTPAARVAVDCPGDMSIPGFSTIPSLSLVGFRITNLDTADRAFSYYLTAEGPATLVDKGDPSSISGSTPTLAPGASYYPPEAGLEIPALRESAQELVTYRVTPIGSTRIVDSCTTVITIASPVAVQISNFEGRVFDSGVELVWNIVSDEEIRGFNVYRTEERAPVSILLNSDCMVPKEARRYIDSSVRGGNMYRYLLSVVRRDGSEVQSQEISVTAKANTLTLHQNYPNPFNPSTTITFNLPEQVYVDLSIFDLQGSWVKTLVGRVVAAGFNEISWDGTDAKGRRVSSGVYFYRLNAGNEVLTRKMVLLQ